MLYKYNEKNTTNFYFFHGFLFSQENKTKTNRKPNVDGWSRSINMSNKEKIKGNISGRIMSLDDKKLLEFATVTLIKSRSNKIIEGTITDSKVDFLMI